MKTFTDNLGRGWAITINVAAIKRVRDLAKVDLLDAAGGDLLERLVSDPVLLCDAVYILCKPEADARGVTDEQFGQAMAGDAIDAATTALLEELVSFFPSGRRQLLSKALAKLRKLEALALSLADQKLDSPDLETQVMAAISGSSSTSSPGSSASTPAP